MTQDATTIATPTAVQYPIEGRTLRPGQVVVCNGFRGVVVRHYASNTWEVRVPGGVVAVCAADVLRFTPPEAC